MIDNKLLKIVETLIKTDAESKRDDAGYSGAMHDGGARELEKELETFLCGINQTFPKRWDKYVNLAKKKMELERLESDPDYIMYKKLQHRFKHLD